jgi:hypothetical protein
VEKEKKEGGVVREDSSERERGQRERERGRDKKQFFGSFLKSCKSISQSQL